MGENNLKILYITFNTPDCFSGGGIGLVADIKAIAENAVDYIGPVISDGSVRNFFNNVMELTPDRSKIKRLFYFIFNRVTSSFYADWKIKISQADLDSYDVIFIERSCFSFVFDDIKRKNILLRLHNVEADYYEKIYKTSGKPIDYIHSKTAYFQERKALKKSTAVVCLTKEDRKRLIDLYSIDPQKAKVVPHGYDPIPYTEKEQKSIFLASGSLWYGPNQEGICWLLDNVWKNVSSECTLMIAGKNPTEEIKDKCKQYSNVILYDSPEDMEPLFNKANFYLAPIFLGAGIKIKVAEAILYKLPVIGTVHAFIGYNLDNSTSLFTVENADSFAKKIIELSELNDEEYKQMRENLTLMYDQNCSADRCRKLLLNIMENLNENICH